MLAQALLAPGPVNVVVDVAPVHNALASLATISAVDDNQGLSAWSQQTAAAVDSARRDRNLMLMHGLGLDALSNAVSVDEQSSFEDYLEALAAADATTLRDGLLHWVIVAPRLRILRDVPEVELPSAARILADAEVLVGLTAARSDQERLPPEQESLVLDLHELLREPAALQAALVEHLGHLWRRYLRAEWHRIAPTLREAAVALAAVDTTDMTLPEAIRAVSGRDLSEAFRGDQIARFRSLRLIPSLHSGPYTVWSADDEELRLIFGARVPTGRPQAIPELDRAELLHRLKALGDEKRLAIVAALAAEGEMSTAVIQERFDLSSSAASRHLRQLVATGLLDERRDDSALKHYRLGRQAADDMLRHLREAFGARKRRVP